MDVQRFINEIGSFFCVVVVVVVVVVCSLCCVVLLWKRCLFRLLICLLPSLSSSPLLSSSPFLFFSFALLEQYGIEFNEAARQHSTDRRHLRRLLKGNIALVVVLEEIANNNNNNSNNNNNNNNRRQRKRRLCVANTHIFWYVDDVVVLDDDEEAEERAVLFVSCLRWLCLGGGCLLVRLPVCLLSCLITSPLLRPLSPSLFSQGSRFPRCQTLADLDFAPRIGETGVTPQFAAGSLR
jgi:hypothetical protein